MAIKRLFFITALLALCSCTVNDATTESMKSGDGGKVMFNMSPMTRAQISNTQVYGFDGDGAEVGKYAFRVPGVDYTATGLSMIVKAGKWNLVLVSAEPSVLAALQQPYIAAGATMHNMKMWDTAPVSGVLPSAPEIMTAYVDQQIVVVDAQNTGSASMARNVAMIKVVVKDAGGLANGDNNHMVSVSNVPTTLSWAGGLLPNKTAPATGAVPMKGKVIISDNPLNPSTQVSDTLTFIIPAHKGSDFLASNPADTTTSKLKLSIDFGVVGGGRYLKSDVEVPVTPKANKVLVLNLLVKAELKVEAEIHDWVDKYVNADISQTNLQVSKTNMAMSYKDTLIVRSNKNFFISTYDSWVSYRPIDAERIEITTDVDSYVSPRSSFIDVRSGDVVKRININQRPEVGTISVSQNSFWVSPTTGNDWRLIKVNSTGPWVMTAPTPATVTPNNTSGIAGETNVMFTRKKHTGVVSDYTEYYGNSTFTLKNKHTLETITLTSQNLFLEIDELDVPNKIGPNTKLNANVTTCLGGDGLYSVVSKPAWVSGLIPAGIDVTVNADGEPDGEAREAMAKFRHNTDPTYTVDVNIVQDFLITIPPFHYFVIKYTWATRDIDISARFEGNHPTIPGADLVGFDKEPVGWSQGGIANSTIKPGAAGNHRLYNGNILLQWGGDAQGGEGETVFFNAPIVDAASNLPRFVKLVCYANWYSNSSENKGLPVRTTIFAYLGGIMDQVGTNFNNINGQMLYTDSKQQRLSTVYNSLKPSDFDLRFEKLVEVTYDRVKHSAKIVFTGEELNTPPIGTPERMSPLRMAPLTADEIAAAKAKKELEASSFRNH